MGIKRTGAKGTYWCDFRTAEGERVRLSLKTTDKKEARELEAQLIYDVNARIKSKRKDGITIAEAYAHALRVRDDWRSAKRPDSIHMTYKAVVKHFGANCLLSKLTEDSLLDFGEEMFAEGLAPSTVNKRLSIISVLFEEAIKRDTGRVGRSNLRKPSIAYYKVNNTRRRLVTPAEEAQALDLLKASNSPFEQAMADLVTVLADTGMRLAEALGLKPVHINEEYRTILITKTKNDEDRVIPLTVRAYDILVSRRHNNPLFHPLSASTASHIWRRVRAKMGLADDPEFVLHAFRHTFGSTLANAGVDSFRLQKAMGHRSLTSTQGYIKLAVAGLEGLSGIIEKHHQHSALPLEKPSSPVISQSQVALSRTIWEQFIESRRFHGKRPYRYRQKV